MRVGIAGSSSTIALEFCDLLDRDHGVMVGNIASMPADLDRYLICTGYLAGRSLADITLEEAGRTWQLNFLAVAQLCERIFETNDRARVCLLGSESGFAGSYDMAYAGAKAALHLYVETKKLRTRDQMLVGLAPHVIWDSNMTMRRDDLDVLLKRGRATRRRHWLTSREVAQEALHLLFEASTALSGQIIRMRPT